MNLTPWKCIAAAVVVQSSLEDVVIRNFIVIMNQK